jgi:broad specificity phosphatase PhoE
LRGKKLSPITLLRNTLKIIDYRTPSWGEPYAKIENRMRSAVDSALSKYGANDDILFVSHQSPIYILQRSLTGKKLHHNPIARFTRLCSITTFEFDADKNFISFEYVEPAAELY